MGNNMFLILFYALAFLWALLAISLTGNVISEAYDGTTSAINFSMFAIVWAWVALILGFVSCFMSFLPPIINLVFDGLAAIFTFCAAVTMAAKLNVHSCFNDGYLRSNDQITGSNDLTKRCQELQASDAFLWFLFASFVVTTALQARRASGQGIMSTGSGGIRRPAMSQV